MDQNNLTRHDRQILTEYLKEQIQKDLEAMVKIDDVVVIYRIQGGITKLKTLLTLFGV